MDSNITNTSSSIINSIISISSSSSSGDSGTTWVGFLACLIAVIGFGSNYVPVKQFNSGDGLFFQAVMSIGIWVAGMCVYAYQGFPKFEPYALLGGVLWSIGNVMSVPIINTVGMSIGMAIWNVFNLTMGWSTGTFGILGVKKQTVSKPVLNYIGAVIAICSVILYVLVQRVGDNNNNNGDDDKKNEDNNGVDMTVNDDDNRFTVLNDSGDDSTENTVNVNGVEMEIVSVKEPPANLIHRDRLGSESESDTTLEPDDLQTSSVITALQKMPLGPKRILGIVMAVVSGLLYGTCFNPSQHLIDFDDDASNDTMDYVFPHFTGIMLCATVWLIAYSAISKNKPAVYRQIVIPGFVSGLIWAVADIAWFVANKNMPFTVTFPLITTGPTVIGSLWGVLVFKEIRGMKKILTLVCAIVVTIIGVVFISLSKLL